MFHLRNVSFLEQRPVAVADANTEFRLKVWHKVLVRVSAARDAPGTPGPEEAEPEWASSRHCLSCLVTPTSLWWRLMLTEWSWPGTEQGAELQELGQTHQHCRTAHHNQPGLLSSTASCQPRSCSTCPHGHPSPVRKRGLIFEADSPLTFLQASLHSSSRK